MSKLWGVRHIRWVYLNWRVHEFAYQCGRAGLGFGIPNESDIRALDAIWRGEL